jgi:hypothetical protein
MNMPSAYSPGLRILERTVVRRERRLPIRGEVVAKVGETVAPQDVVARTELPGNVQAVNLASRLGLEPGQVPRTVTRPVGADVRRDEEVAVAHGLFGLGRRNVLSPCDGVLESVSPVTGQLMVREPPLPVEVNAYVRGRVVEELAGEGVVVEAHGALLQGIFGVGGETWGPVALAADSPAGELAAGRLRAEHRGHVVVGGAYAGLEALRRAQELQVSAVVVGGIEDLVLRELLGRDLGVAITGAEDLGLTVVLTEGFGRIAMSDRAWGLLAARAGRLASVSGATQVRAGVVRPEVLVPEADGGGAEVAEDGEVELAIGVQVRVIRAPDFGRIGRVVELPAEPRRLDTESLVRVVMVVFPGQCVPVALPRANVEVIVA